MSKKRFIDHQVILDTIEKQFEGLDDNAVLNTSTAAALIGVSSGALRKWRYEGVGPPWRRVSPKPNGRAAYPVSTLKQYLREAALTE